MILESVSDIVFLDLIIYTVSIFSELNENLIKNKKRIIISAIISCVFSIIFSRNYFSQILVYKLLFVFINFSKYILLTAYVYKSFSVKLIITSFIAQFICSIISSSLLNVIPISEINEIYFYNIILNLAVRTAALAIVLYIKNEYENIKAFIKIIPKYIYALILFSLFLLNGLIQAANFVTSNYTLQINIFKILASSTTICVIIIILSLLFSVISKNYQNEINTALKKQIETQLYHYKQLEKINAEIRRFKHDYINHMKCIASMASDREYDRILDYVGRLSSAFPAPSFLFETGNYIADAVLTEKQINSPDDISIEFDGVVPADIDNVDLCIILSNALDNAVEACSSCRGNKSVSVYSAVKHGYFVLKIKNPTVTTELNGRITTTKPDKINHGFGLSNIKRTVGKYGGRVSVCCEDNVFTLSVTLSM